MSEPLTAPDVDLLTQDRFITIEDLIERVVRALDEGTPWGMTRWADASNLMMRHGFQDPTYQFAHVANRLSARYYNGYRDAFLSGVAACDVLGVFHNDCGTNRVFAENVGDVTQGKELVYAWCNKHVNARREWAEEVLQRPLRVALVGNRMPEYRPWLVEHFPNLTVVQCDVADDFPDVLAAMQRFASTKPEFALLSAGWFTSCLVGAAKRAGAVAFSYGHCPDYHLEGRLCPNTTLPRGPAGCLEYYQTLADPVLVADREMHHRGIMEQEREIIFPWRESS